MDPTISKERGSARCETATHSGGKQTLQRAAGNGLALLLLASVAGAFGAAAQEKLPTSTATTTAAPTTALQILQAAAVAQGTTPADHPLALHVKVQLQYKTQKGDEISVEAERKFLAPNRLWTWAKSSFDGSETITGFDGKQPWIWSKKSGLRPLDQPGGETDRKQLLEDLELTKLLTNAFQLARLGANFEHLERLSDVSGFGMTAWVIEGDLKVERDGAAKVAKLRLFIEQEKRHLMGAGVAIEGEAPVQICFTKHQRVDGFDVPRKIEIYRDGEKTPMQTLFVDSLKLDPGFTDADFAPPK